MLSLWGRPENTDSGSFGPLGASGGLQSPNQTDNGKLKSCVWHIGAGWKHPTGPEAVNHDDITLGTSQNTDSGSYEPLEVPGGL